MDHPPQLANNSGYYQMPPTMHPLPLNPNQQNVQPLYYAQNYYLINSTQPIYNIAHHPPSSSFVQQVQKNDIVSQPYHQTQKFIPHPEVQVPNQRKHRIPICDPVTRKEIDVMSIPQRQTSIAVPPIQNISKNIATKPTSIRILTRPTIKPVKSKESSINWELNNNEVSSTIAFIDSQESINPNQEILNSSQEIIHSELKTPPITPLATNSLIFTPPPCVNKTCVVLPSPRKIFDTEIITTNASPTDTLPTDNSPLHTISEVNFANNTETPIETVSKSTTTELIVDNLHLPSTTEQSTVIEMLSPPSTSITEIPPQQSQSKPQKSRFITEQQIIIKPGNNKKVSFQEQQITPTKYKKKGTSRGSKILIGPAPYDQNRYAQQRLQDDYLTTRNKIDNRFDGFNQRPPQNDRRFPNDRNNRQYNNQSNTNRFNENAPPRFRQDKSLQHTNYHNNPQQQHNQHHNNPQQQHNQHHNNMQQQHNQHHNNMQQQHNQHHNNMQQQHNQHHINMQHQHNQHENNPQQQFHHNNHRYSQMKNNRNRNSNLRPINCEESALANKNILNEKAIETHNEIKWPAINENASRRKVTSEMPYTEKKMLPDEQKIQNDIENEGSLEINDDLPTITIENQCDTTTADSTLEPQNFNKSHAVLNDVQPTVEKSDEVINMSVPDNNVDSDVKEEVEEITAKHQSIDVSIEKATAMPETINLPEIKDDEIIKSKENINETKPSNFDVKIKHETIAKPLHDYKAKIETKKHDITKKNETKYVQQSDRAKSTVSASNMNKQKNQKKSAITVNEQQKHSTNASKQLAEKNSVPENKGRKSNKKRSKKDKQRLETIVSTNKKDLPALQELQKSDCDKNVSVQPTNEKDLPALLELQKSDCDKNVSVQPIDDSSKTDVEGDLLRPIEDEQKVEHEPIDDIQIANKIEISSNSDNKVSTMSESDECSQMAQELVKPIDDDHKTEAPFTIIACKDDLVQPTEDGPKVVQEFYDNIDIANTTTDISKVSTQSKQSQIKINCSICNDPESSIRHKYNFQQLWEKCATKLSTKKFERTSNADIYQDFDMYHILRRQKRELAKLLSVSKSKIIQTKSNSFKKPPIVHISLSLREDVKLNECQNAWKPSHLTKSTSQSLLPQINSTDDLYKKVRSILNRLTPEYFDNLLEQIKILNIDTNEKLQGVILLVFEKAIDEQCYAESYSILCERLSQLVADHQNANERATFKRSLITKCQEEFHTHVMDPNMMAKKLEPYRLQHMACAKDDVNKRAELLAIIDEEERKLRRRSVGTCKFVGELYKQKMLTARIMFECIKNLCNANTEQHLECLCTFLTTIGETMEKRNENLSQTFDEMTVRIRNKRNNLSNRVRFMMQDLIDLRASKWCNRKGLAAEFVPKTMDACERDIKMKLAREQAVISPPPPSKHSKNQQSNIQIKRRDSDGKLFFGNSKITQSHVAASPMPNFMKLSQPISSNTMLGNRNQYNWTQKQSQPQQKPNYSLAPAQMSSQSDNDLNPPDKVLIKIQNTIKEQINLLKPQNNTIRFESLTDIPKQYKCVCVRELFNICIESTAITKMQRINAGKLCANWLRMKQINVNQCIVGLTDILDYLEDLIIDIPMIITYISELLCPILDDGILTMSDLELATKGVRKTLLADRFLSTFVDYLINELTLPIVQKLAIGQIWIRLPTIDEQIQKFLQNNTNLSIDYMYNYITKNCNEMNEQFIRKLTTIIIEQSLHFSTDNFHHHEQINDTTAQCRIHIDKDKLQKNLLLLEKLLDNNESLTIGCLYAIQMLVHKLEHPQGLINELVHQFYDFNIVSKEIFFEWQQSNILPEGKGVVLKGLKTFFDYLDEQSGSDDDEDN